MMTKTTLRFVVFLLTVAFSSAFAHPVAQTAEMTPMLAAISCMLVLLNVAIAAAAIAFTRTVRSSSTA